MSETHQPAEGTPEPAGGPVTAFLRSRPLALATALAAPAAAGGGLAYYTANDAGARRMVEVELAGSVGGIEAVVGRGLATVDPYRQALGADDVFIAGYALALALAGLLGTAVFVTRPARRLAAVAAVAGPLAALLDVGENLALRQVLDCLTRPAGTCAGGNGWAAAAQALAFAKFVLVVPAVAVAVVAVVTALWRLTRHAVDPPAPPDGLDGFFPQPGPLLPSTDPLLPPPDPAAERPSGERAHWRENAFVPPGREPEQVGICLSGGGIRSATTCLGALQVMREHGTLGDARYLVSVSGGGYLAGAVRLAVQPPPPDSGLTGLVDPRTVFAPGSPETDHLRRHGKYLADGAGQWVVALGTLLRGLLANLVTIGLVVVAARLLAHGYARAPALRAAFAHPWPPPKGVSWAVGLTAAAAALLWVLAVLTSPRTGRRGRRVRGVLSGGSRTLSAATVLLAGVGLLVPVLVWLGDVALPGRLSHANGQQTAAAAGAAVSVGYLAALAAILWRRRATITGAVGTVRGAVEKVAPAGVRTTLAQRLVVHAGLVVIVAALLLVFGRVLAGTGAAGAGAPGPWPDGVREWHLTAAAAVVLAFLAVALDQTRWSLHPFYKRRLASAFAVRRVLDHGRVQARPYDFDAEVTDLDTYGTHIPGLPQVIFAAAANVSGQQQAPPGRRCVPYTFSSDYVGGPTTGWVGTGHLRETVSATLRLDLTVQAAQAISGAAFASAMGRHSKPFGVLLALTNARLGAWLPNPGCLRTLTRDGPHDWWLPRLPGRRRLHYLAREVFGIYPAHSRLLLLTDGGHYENLGLVELLRLRCRRVLCVDASGDSPGLPATLAEAVTLAHEELGVTVELDDPQDLAAGSGSFPFKAAGPLAGLEPALAKTSVVTGTIHYPDLGPGLPATTRHLVVGKATLTGDTPFDVLAHAAHRPPFPFDPTGDQWFDHALFDAYHALGRHVGEHMLAEVPTVVPVPPQEGPAAPAGRT